MKQFEWYLTRARSELIPWVLSRIPRQPIGIYAISGVIGAGASVFVVHDAGRWSAVMSVLMAVTSIACCAMGLLAYRKSKQVIGDLSVPNDRCAAQAARSHRLLITSGTLAFASVMVMAASALAMGFRTLWVSYVLITPMIAAAVYSLVQAASRARASEMAPSLLVAVNANDTPKGVELLEFASRPKARASWAIAAIASTGRESFAQARRMANLTGDPTAPRAVEFPGATVDLAHVAAVRSRAGAYGFVIWLPFAILPLILAGLVPTGAYPRVPGPGDVIAALRSQSDRGVDDKNAQSVEPGDEPEQTDPQHDGTAGAGDIAEQSGGSEGSGTEPETEEGPDDGPSDGDDPGQAPGGADGTADEGDAGTGENAGADGAPADGAPADGASEAGPEGSQSGSDGAAADGDSAGESSTEGAEAGGDDAAAGEASNRAPPEADREGQSAEGDAGTDVGADTGTDTGTEVEGAQETGEAQGEATGDVPDEAGGDVADGGTTGADGEQSEPGDTEPSEQEGTQGEASAEGAGDAGGEVAEAGEAPGEGTPNAEGREPGGEADAETEPPAGPEGGGEASEAGEAEPGAPEASEAEAENADPQGGEGGQSGQVETGLGGNSAEAGSDDADASPEGAPSTDGDPDGAEPGEGEAAEGAGGGASEAEQADAETSDAAGPQSPAEGAPPPTDTPNSDGGIGGQEPPTPNGEEDDASVNSGGEADVADEDDAQEVSVGGAPDGAGAGTPDAGAEAEPLAPQPPSTRPDEVLPEATATRAEEDAVDPAVLEDLNLRLVDVAADLDADLATQSLGAAQGPRQQFAAPGDIADMIVLPPASVVQDVPTTPAVPPRQLLPAWIDLLLRSE